MKPMIAGILAVGALLMVSFPRTTHAQDPYFPDGIFDPKDEERNKSDDQTTSAHLMALKEPSLWKKSREDKTATIYRFLWRGWSEHPTSIRVSRIGDEITMHVSRNDSHPGLLNEGDHPKLIVDREVKLTRKQWDDLKSRLDAAQFWTSPTDVPQNAGIGDGDLLFIEGIHEGKYHAVMRHRLISKKDYEPIFREVLEIAGTDVSESWDDLMKRSYVREFYKKHPPK